MTAVTETAAQEKRKFDFSGFLQRFGTLGIFIALVVAASIWSPSFLTKPNILNVLRQVASSAGIMAVGMLYVILTRRHRPLGRVDCRARLRAERLFPCVFRLQRR